MTAHWTDVVALVLLTVAAAFFAMSETALISLTRLRVSTLAERDGAASTTLQNLLHDRNRVLTSILVCNTFVLLASDSLATYYFLAIGVPNGAIWSTVVMTFVILIFGEIVPKTIAVANGETWALRLARPLSIITMILTPITMTLLAVTSILVRILGGKQAAPGPYLTEEDIRSIVNVGVEQNVLEAEERELIHSIIEFGDTICREVMTPRPDMICVNVAASPQRALDLVIRDGYSKLPVYEETVDNVIGVVHDRELLIALANDALANVPLRSLMRPVAYIPESKRISDLLRDMQRGKFSLAIVLDEYGGTAGLVTMEDLLEEIVGEIRDEHDEGEEEPIRIVAEDESVVEAGVNIEDVNARLGTTLPHEEFETIGGLTVGLFGRIPREGEEVSAGEGVKLRIDRTRGRRILSVRVLTNGKAHDPTDEPDALETTPDDARTV